MIIKLQKEYRTFWTNFEQCVDRKLSIRVNDTPFKFSREANRIVIKTEIYFKGCRYRSSSPKTNLDICIYAQETIVENNGIMEIEKSTVNVNYFEISNSQTEAELIESIHYDFDKNVKSLNHPLFHCQLNSKSEDLPKSFNENYKNINTTGLLKRHKCVRIPTANMDLLSVLLSIAADHFDPIIFKNIIDSCNTQKWHNKLPHFKHHNFSSRIKNEEHISFRSNCWYVN